VWKGRSASRSVTTLLITLAAPLTAAASHAAPCPPTLESCRDESCGVRFVRCALDRASRPPSAAVDAARAALEAWPESGRLHVLAAAAYLRADNPVWALRTLLRRVSQAPDDCDAATWLAWVQLRLDQPEGAAALLDDPACLRDDAAGTRRLLVRALAEHKTGDAVAAADDLDRARRQATIDASDAVALGALSRAAEPDRVRHVTWRLEASAGWSTNPLLGAPNDPEVAAAADGSGYLQLDGWARLAPDPALPVRPLLELQPRLVRYLSEGTEGLSTLILSGRAGVLLGRDFPRLTLAWRPDYVLLELGDTYSPGPLWYYGAHRAEAELEVSRGLVVFAGGGRRDFRELGRSRWEADLGAGGGVSLAARWSLLWAVTGRAHVAQDKAYDLYGGTAIFSLDARLPAALWARATGGVGLDWYPSSAFAFDIADERRDLAVRAGLQLGLAPEPGVRVGLGWEMTWRDSTVPEYAATDHRVSLRVAWSGAVDTAGPEPIPDALLAPLGWGLDGGDDGTGERVQDLLRRDEQVRPGCGCGL